MDTFRRNTPTRGLCLAASLVLAGGCSAPEAQIPAQAETLELDLTAVESGTESLLQAISPVDSTVVWVSGHRATYARSLDGGETWSAGVVPGDSSLQFRDVAAFDDATAYLMSAGTGDASRIYRTDDGGTSWTLQYTADHPEAFLDCMDFWSVDRGLVYGDEVDGVPFILMTEDGGANWSRVPAAGLPPALDGEGGFAASGTCLETGPDGTAWIATGAGERPRVLRTSDYGTTWEVADAPVAAGPSSGLTTIRMGTGGRGYALGGSIGSDSVRVDAVAATSDGGRTWSVPGALAMAGPVYGAALALERPAGDVLVAVGPRGLDWSTDSGRSWTTAESTTYWAVDFVHERRGWAVGPGGRITVLTLRPGPAPER